MSKPWIRVLGGELIQREKDLLKKLLSWGAVGLLTTALLDPLIYSLLDKPVPWGRDLLMALGGIGCFSLLLKYRDWF